MKRAVIIHLFVVLITLIAYSVKPAGAVEDAKKKPLDSIVGVWAISENGNEVILASFLNPSPIRTKLAPDTQLEGVCVHCQMALKCSVSELGKRCAVCPCELSNSACFTEKNNASKNSGTLLQFIPRGTLLKIDYSSPETSNARVNRIVLDRRSALLPVEGLGDVSTEQIQALGKSVGAIRTELNDAKTRLQFSLKDNWTSEKELRIEKEMLKLKAKIVSPPSDTTGS